MTSSEEDLKNTFCLAANTLTKLYMGGVEEKKRAYQNGIDDTISKIQNFIQKDAVCDKNGVNRLLQYLEFLKRDGNSTKNDDSTISRDSTLFRPVSFMFDVGIQNTPSNGFSNFQFEPKSIDFSQLGNSGPQNVNSFNFETFTNVPFENETVFKDSSRKRMNSDFEFDQNKRLRPDQ